MVQFSRKPIEGVMMLNPLCIDDDGSIDHDGVRSNIRWLEARGFHGVIQLANMGQVNAPSEDEYDELVDLCVDATDDLACVVGGTAPNQKEVVRRVRYAEEAGADGSMVSLPYMLPLKREWVGTFYREIDAALDGDIAVMAYNNPGVNGCNISSDVWAEDLLEVESVKALKESNFDMIHRGDVLATIADRVNFVSGLDGYFFQDSMLGAAGFIGVLPWVAPSVFLRLYEACENDDHHDPWVRETSRAVAKAWGRITGLPGAPMESSEQAILNEIAEIGGGVGGPPRPPYRPLPSEARTELEDAVRPLVEMEDEMRG